MKGHTLSATDSAGAVRAGFGSAPFLPPRQRTDVGGGGSEGVSGGGLALSREVEVLSARLDWGGSWGRLKDGTQAPLNV